MTYFAHSLPDAGPEHWQLLRDHLQEVQRLAGARAEPFGAGGLAALAGLLHDLGKYTAGFQRRLSGGDPVDHSTAGAREILALAGSAGGARLMAQLVAHGVAGHHAGLPDSIGDLDDRLDKKDFEPLDAIWRNEIAPDPALLTPPFPPSKDKREAGFQLGLLGRMIFSCLVDADFRDTEDFYAKAEGREVDRAWPSLPEIIENLSAKLDSHLAGFAADTPVNRLRAEILAHVRAQSAKPRGAFSLNVPTGGGKTLASLAFALDHARVHGLRRIIYAIPFTSVIDQTAAIFKKILGDEVVLEHHSSIDEEGFCGREARDKLRLAMEDWAAPIVVTTNVQLFESLFSHRPSRCRRLHNLANSVIVLDEAQTLPLHVLRPCVAALDELTRHYGASVVVCTATQPAISAEKFLRGLALGPTRELAPDPQGLHEKLRRVTVVDAGTLDDEHLLDELTEVDQGLIIVNSRAHALALFQAGLRRGASGLIHLTTRQCAAHRREILGEIRQRLKGSAPCRVIATSLVEAGVDLDFPRVWRARAGLDQIAQAAGRCNREGKRDVAHSIVTLFDAADFPPPQELKALAEDMRRVAGKHPDIFSPQAIADYFERVYWRKGEERLDKFEALEAFGFSGGKISFSYRSLGEKFRLIESGMAPVIIAYDAKASETLDRLKAGFLRPGAAARALQAYVVQVSPAARALLIANGHVCFADPPARDRPQSQQFAELVNGSLYRVEFGLFWENANYLSAEQFLL